MARNLDLRNASALGIVVQSYVAIMDAHLRARVANMKVRTFILVNVVVLAMILLFFIVDHILIFTTYATKIEPIVTGRTARVLIGASVVQLGFFAIGIGRYLFPPPRPWSLRDRLWGR
jgi:hypothetical protein